MLWNSALAQLLERVDEKEADLQLTAEQIFASLLSMERALCRS